MTTSQGMVVVGAVPVLERDQLGWAEMVGRFGFEGGGLHGDLAPGVSFACPLSLAEACGKGYSRDTLRLVHLAGSRSLERMKKTKAKLRVGVLFGGKSGEHEVSLLSRGFDSEGDRPEEV